MSIFINPVKLAQDCEDDKNLAGSVENGVILIQEAVSIMRWKRVECIGEDSRLTLWKNPEDKVLGHFPCVGQCGWSLPNGTNICWNYRCHAPANEAGYSD